MTKEEYMEKRLRYLLESERSEEVAYEMFDREFSPEARKKLTTPEEPESPKVGVAVKKVGATMSPMRKPPYKGRKA